MLKYHLEAKFEDGFEYVSGKDDASRYDSRRNAFFDIWRKDNDAPGPAVEEHGRLMHFALVGNDGVRYDVDFSEFPPDAKPIYYLIREKDSTIELQSGKVISESPTRTMLYGFGYEFINADGEKEKEVIEVA